MFNIRLKSFIKKFSILYNSQYGFRNNFSTALALTELVEEITNTNDLGKCQISLFIDLSKAFDTINHQILLTKLDNYGIRGIALDWLKSYLTNRSQFVDINGKYSKKANITCGIPQGSIIGPILFILYINDLHKVSNRLKFILFADDTTILCEGDNVQTAAKMFNKEILKVNKWFQANRLSLNLTKTHYMVFNGGKKSGNTEIIINNNNIDRVDSTKFLGVLIDQKLTWNEHIKLVESKIAKSIAIMYRVKHIIEPNTLLTLYCSLVLPYLDYCSEVWGNNYNSRLNNLCIMQKRCIRLITNSGYRDHTTPLFHKLKLLNFKDLIKLKTVKLAFKANQNKLPSEIQKKYLHLNYTYGTRQKSNLNFVKHYCRTTQKSFSPINISIDIWNNCAKRTY